MARFLVFRLYGPLASWGPVAVGEHRLSDDHPSRSALLGLLGACLGIRRSDDAQQLALASAYALAVRLDASGELLRDYHTVQVPPATALRKRRAATRGEELDALREHNRSKGASEGTILSQRDYRADALATAVVWPRSAAPPWSLDALAEALRRPRLVPYLGRKSCPLSLPLAPEVVEAPTVRALLAAVTPAGDLLADLALDPVARLYWDPADQDVVGWAPEMVYQKRDQPASRTRWQFRQRAEAMRAEPARREDT